jgi:uncharacterized HAD superfamily protein
MNSVKLGIDLDGVLSAQPQAVRCLMKAFGPANCHIVTARCKKDKDLTFKHLADYWISQSDFATISFFPPDYDLRDFLKNPGKYYPGFVKYKVERCKTLGIDLMLEDDFHYKKPLEKAGIKVLMVYDETKFCV